MAQTTVPLPLAHHELGSILGHDALFGLSEYRSPAADPLPVVLEQLRACEAALTGPTVPERIPLSNVAWENLYSAMGTVLYLSASVGTTPRLREILHGLLEAWRASSFCRDRTRFRLQTGKLDGPLLLGVDSQRIVQHEGTRSLLKVITWARAKPGETTTMSVRVLSHAEKGAFAPLPGFTAETSVPGSHAPHQDPESSAALLGRYLGEGAPTYTREIGAELARRAGLSEAAAALLWAGNTDATDAVRVVATPEARRALGLTVKAVTATSRELYPLHDYLAGERPRTGFYQAYNLAMPSEVERLWRPLDGGDDSVVGRLGRAVSDRLQAMPNRRR